MRRPIAAMMLLAAVLGVVLAIAGGWTFSASFAGTSSDDPEALTEEFGWREDLPPIQRWDPPALAGTGRRAALARWQDNAPVILFQADKGGGGMTYVSGWAVEAGTVDTDTGTVYFGVTIADAATVRFGKGRDALRVPTEPYPGDPSKRLFAVHVPVDGLSRVHPNDIVALDERGRLLGRQHYNDGKGGSGEYDGLYDRRFAKRR
ncbi:hypothetical protein OJ997_17535 [Solirubrobacter phytolaccae]|uniref:Uncharacterized protein n=1 Tax=Solirubrobacter phytolaccae TaxID=1404360 RepID=A0A9X3NIT1_9ACTN|nr:hypothetical protein [Solirubrobacter phytolaccae]MDA0182112.1 hypothetical protein [Solirubrobacter phytolaccae]